MLPYLENNRHDFDFNECRPQKIMKKNTQNPISCVNFPAEHVPGVRKCKAIHGKRGKAVKVRFYEKMMKKITFIQFLDSLRFLEFFPTTGSSSASNFTLTYITWIFFFDKILIFTIFFHFQLFYPKFWTQMARERPLKNFSSG